MPTDNWRKEFCVGGHPITRARYRNGACVECRKEASKKRYKERRDDLVEASVRWAKENPESRRDAQRAYRLKVPVDEVRRVIEASQGACEACKKPLLHKDMCIDHCHDTGKVRGVLCRFCNALEGMLKKTEQIAQIRDYLSRKR